MIPANPTAIVADDEPLLRARLVSLLSMTWPELTILPQAQNGREAVELCETHRPDIAFLDIRMPLISGIDVARMLPSSTRVVFVTAYDEYAVRAFEAGAADYLIKPIEPVRLSATVDRLKASLHQASIKSRDMEVFLAELSAKIRPEQPKFLEWIRASVGQRVKLIHVDDILYFRSYEKYTRVVTSTTEVLIRRSICDLLGELEPKRFVQIQRGAIVNLHAIDHVERTDADWLLLHVKGVNEALRVSRNFVHLFRQM
ncbi:MAG: LytR/AlgR family response regulator transcription factor [Burkholderiales bacterium]|nr:response regulator transcription factor [Rhodocyclaceae bacterium]